MNIKKFELRDRATYIPVIAIRAFDYDGFKESWFFGSSGYRSGDVLLIPIQAPWLSSRCSEEQRGLNGRTLKFAHDYIEKNWTDLEDGQVIDVEYILGEKDSPSKSIIEEEVEEILMGKMERL